MTPRELLDAADALLSERRPSLQRCWQRACAAFLRGAWELILDQYWTRRAPGVAVANIRTQLLVLPQVADPELAALARRSWHGLSAAMHHHSYELPPTAAELRSWHRDISKLLTQLRD